MKAVKRACVGTRDKTWNLASHQVQVHSSEAMKIKMKREEKKHSWLTGRQSSRPRQLFRVTARLQTVQVLGYLKFFLFFFFFFFFFVYYCGQLIVAGEHDERSAASQRSLFGVAKTSEKSRRSLSARDFISVFYFAL